MKILIFVKSLDGGTGTFVEGILRLNKYKNMVPIGVLALEEPTYRKIPYDAQFIHSKNYYSQNYGFTLPSIVSFIKECIVVKNTIGEINPQIILAVDVQCNILALLYQLLFYPHLKVIASTHIQLSATLQHKASILLNTVLRKLITFLYNRADAIVVVSNGVKTDLISHFRIKRKITVIHNGVLLMKVRAIHRENIKNRILSIGRLVPQKDFITLIYAFAELIEDIPDAQLTIVGDGIQKKILISLVKYLKLGKKVVFKGWKHINSKYFNNTDIFILSSFREGFPYVLLEAMNAGVPIISTDSPFGPKELLENDKYGIVIPMKDITKMSSAMKFLFNNKKAYEYYAKKATLRARTFALRFMLNKYKKLITEID
ncbi:MAG: glycosyltransferase [Candidatus Roizmanbacteria bacterium]|nr:glycosyltransferase [Candidatus Roizmanbacteria bacterium]